MMAARRPFYPFQAFTPSRFVLLVGLLSVAAPTLISVGRRYWGSAEGSQGPIVFATAVWLVWRKRDILRRQAIPLLHTAWALLIVPLALIYAFSRTYGSLFGETAALYLISGFTALLYLGSKAIARHWFAFFYPAFLIVPPVTLVTELTQPLRLWISKLSVDLLHSFGLPIALSGASIQIAQYELLVRTACAGLGSMFTLCAVGLFYAYLRRGSQLLPAVILVCMVLPVAIFANFIRVLILVLLTWFAGVEAAQGVAHQFAGLLMFCVAMAGMFLVDSAIASSVVARPSD